MKTARLIMYHKQSINARTELLQDLRPSFSHNIDQMRVGICPVRILRKLKAQECS